MAKQPKNKPTKSEAYAGSLGAALDEIVVKPIGRRIKVKTGVSLSSHGLKVKARQDRQQD